MADLDLSALATEGLHPLAEGLESLDSGALMARMQAVDAEVLPALEGLTAPLAELVDAVARCVGDGGRLLYVGAGTSGRLGVLDAVECQPTFGLPAGVVMASIAGGAQALTAAVEGAEDDREAGAAAVRERTQPGDVVVGIAASGRTPYVLGALAWARASQRATALICCSAPPPEVAVDWLLHAPVGPELLSGSTRLKSGTATKLLLNRLSTGAMIRLGKVYRGRMVDVTPACGKLEDRAARIVVALTGVERSRAEALLEASGWRVKPAVLMAGGATLEQAEARLAAADGRLDRALS